MLKAINEVCANNRAAIRDAAFAVRDFDGVLGTWSFNEEGDTTLTDMNGFQVKGGRWEFVAELK